MNDPLPPAEYEITPDGYLRKAGQLAEVLPAPDAPFDPTLLSSLSDADADAARRFIRIEQTPVQIVGFPPG